MKNIEFSHNGKTYKRINKTTAKRLYAAGETIYIQCCNFRLFNNWIYPSIINQEKIENKLELNTFEKFVNAFEYYLCNNSETGKYAAFYIVSGEGEK